MAIQFNTTFQKLDDLKDWFEEQMDPASSEGGVIQNMELGLKLFDPHSIQSQKLPR